MNPFLSDRENKILNMLIEDYNLSVTKISEMLGVSAVTIRSDLSSMEEKGFILRTRGGALPVFHPDIIQSQRQKQEEKNRIAKAAADMVEEGDAIMIDDGTTTSLVLKYLMGKRNIHVVTNSTLALTYARVNPTLHLTVVGGEFKPGSESLVGPVSLSHLERYHVKYAFVGTGGFSAETGMTTHIEESAEIIKYMARQSDNTILLADSGKYGKSGFVKILPLDSVDMIITDTDMNKEQVDEILEKGIKVKQV
ncbi:MULTISPECIES: DeoR/GlpR family DNA-binding transcription regulator [unclassified Oceanispirochaeta]|uniref:DeoR/GlpR family DNA-binding transcription regulator n=1 Tax=unclassified Oceanispirochaeta TaxID=2635722 RepID=UPI000E08F209|nr:MULTISPECIES: DeoR/GlpR family DNA-binding transcription regulator [unclassified Oceanispirochaeta]MBF9014456.1 DeoR/GlpR transcriptional regulator [Oceanispirochaeta sp. M2]NPD70712.1 DeoR/GlpR transcriptional regulator [Oceanispirochaeta sp. M1]RDG33996.1 DeoR/GlpR transcriptional regulator [Oceanispirochaeta sp. M1]